MTILLIRIDSLLTSDLQCDGESPCAQCANTNGKLWQLGCQRGNLQDRLKDKFSSEFVAIPRTATGSHYIIEGLAGFGSSEWFLPTRDGFGVRIRMKYDDPKLEIRDHGLSSCLAATQPQSKDSLLDFLKQFHDINSRWGNYYSRGNYYEPATEDLITLCAQIQEDILSRTSRMPANLSEEILLIALSLRTLAFARTFGLISEHLPEDSCVATFFLQSEMVRDKYRSLEIWRCGPAAESTSACLGRDGGEQFSSMIEDIVRITQRLHFRRRPKDWPALFCVLCLLKLILTEISDCPILDTFGYAHDTLESVWSMLCQLYHVCTKGNHPLTHDWSVEEYTPLVENDTLAIAHFRLLNDMWVEGTSTSFLCATKILRLLTNIVKAGRSVMRFASENRSFCFWTRSSGLTKDRLFQKYLLLILVYRLFDPAREQ